MARKENWCQAYENLLFSNDGAQSKIEKTETRQKSEEINFYGLQWRDKRLPMYRSGHKEDLN